MNPGLRHRANGRARRAAMVLAALWLALAAGAMAAEPINPVLSVYLGPAAARGRFAVVAAGQAAPAPRSGVTLLEGGSIEELKGTLVWKTRLAEYLPGAVGGEMGASAPLEALKAQAIASRTWALRSLDKPIRPGVANMELGERSQAYDFASGRAAIVRRAARETEGMALRDDNGGYPLAPFHACCGGHTALASTAWRGSEDPPHLAAQLATERPAATRRRLGVDEFSTEPAARAWHHDAAVDGWCAPGRDGVPSFASKDYRWSRDVPAAEAARLGIERWKAVREASGRIALLEVPTGAVRGDLTIRRLFNPPLRSSNFSWEPKGDGGFTLYGAGAGHGVGMCQACAMGKAAQGLDAAEILARFYDDPVRVEALEPTEPPE